MAKNQNTAVAVKDEKTNALALMGVDFAADAGMGMEGVDKDSFAIPFIALLQGLSPQLETVDAAKPGLFINTITDEVFKEVLVVPCAYQRRYLRWAPRSEGGGYKGEYNPIDIETGKILGVEKDADGRLRLEGDELKDTRNHFVLMQSESGAWQPALLSLSSTQIKKSKRWMSRIQGIELRTPEGKAFNPPSFSHVYKLKAVKEENSKGSWWGVDVELVEPVSDAELYLRAKEFNKQVAAGEVKVQEPVSDHAAEAGSDDRF
ncbi:MAG: hypothetical protein E6Q97_19655 [Desulfurellales bacterium]|nr:MAG: hypothetical protein E6Q97_19655 [Desulfurellales bacterium]